MPIDRVGVPDYRDGVDCVVLGALGELAPALQRQLDRIELEERALVGLVQLDAHRRLELR